MAPALIQVEAHPYHAQDQLRERFAPLGTKIESWYPLGHGDAGLLNEAIFKRLAIKYGKSPAQIILRWHIQKGNIVFPGSQNPDHIRENIAIFDFALTDEEWLKLLNWMVARNTTPHPWLNRKRPSSIFTQQIKGLVNTCLLLVVLSFCPHFKILFL